MSDRPRGDVRGWYGPAWALYLMLLCFSCARPDEHGADKLIAVPFVPQKSGWCGPASLAMVLRFWGHSISQEQIADRIYDPRLKGTLPNDMVVFARDLGFLADLRTATLDDIAGDVERGQPVILLLEKPPYRRRVEGISHYVVVVGYDPANDQFIIHTDRRRFLHVSRHELSKSWPEERFLAITVKSRSGDNH